MTTTLDPTDSDASMPFVLDLGALRLDLARQQAFVSGRPVHLTLSELKLLTLLAEQPGVPVPRTTLMQRLWASDHVGDGHACEVHVSNLRRKIEDDPTRPRRLLTVRGVGYKLVPA
jgi:two-component system response regulator RegX3